MRRGAVKDGPDPIDQLRRLAEERAKEGKPTPSWDNQPKIEPRTRMAWKAANELAAAKTQPVQVLAWCIMHGITDTLSLQETWEAVWAFERHREEMGEGDGARADSYCG